MNTHKDLKVPEIKIDRRKIEWEKVKGWEPWTAIMTGTFLGSGLLPKMPGTWGTLAAMPLAWFIAPFSVGEKLVVWTLLLAAGTWAGKKFHDLFGVADNQNIVMDEAVGVGITSLFIARDDWKLWIAAFLFFRLFDIVKLPPVSAVDRWSKGKPGVPLNPWISGFGVMADDVIAGIQGLIVLVVLARYLN